MIHHQGNQNKKTLRGKNLVFLALFVLSLLFALYAPLRGVLTEGVYSIAPSVREFINIPTSIIKSFFTNFHMKDTLTLENSTLREDVARMQIQVLDRNLLEEKVNSLMETLGRVEGDNRVVARVLSGPSFSPYDTLVVDAGDNAGVALGGMVVYAGAGVIGEVVEVTEKSSKIKLHSSPGEEHFVLIGTNVLPAKAIGRGMGNFEASVPEDSLVVLGDSVISIKDDLILGTVSFIEVEPALPTKRIFFRLPFNINEIRTVEIIINKGV